jgi:biofilm PGA synthesis N-glycosyltransferase PgaC
MDYWLNLTLFKMGFWLTWALVPIVVEILPAMLSAIRLFIKTLRTPQVEMPDKMPVISVIVPIYNSEETLFNCIRSIHASSYPSDLIQVILADNQSTDNSFDVFAHAQNEFTDLNMQLIHTEKGKASALNSAIYTCIGTYIINIDSDGVLEKHALMNMVLQFENDYSVSALTGTILPQREMIKAEHSWRKRLLQQNEYFEYAQAFLSGRTMEANHNQIFTMSGAFSAFRKNALLQTFMYNTDTIGEDTDMTFQIRDRLKQRVAICANAIFYVEPIPSFGNLYTQRQRWQRGEIEVIHQYANNVAMKNFFSDFLIRRIIIDHTFLFPKMIWLCASIALLFFRYSPVMMGMSYLIIYLLYLVVEILNYGCVNLLLHDFKEERQFYHSVWWVCFTLPIYNFICSFIRFVGTINSMTEASTWNLTSIETEAKGAKVIVGNDFKNLRKRRGK